MRKVDLVVVVSVVAMAAAWWNIQPGKSRPDPPVRPIGSATPAPAGLTTRSGRWTVLPNRYQMAGLSIGMSEAEIVAKMGEPGQKDPQNGESSMWTYTSDGAELHLALLEDRLIMIGGSGRWALTQGDKSLPGFQSSPEQLLAVLGPPDRKESADTTWIYAHRPGELSFTIMGDRVSHVTVTGEVAPQKIPAAPPNY